MKSMAMIWAHGHLAYAALTQQGSMNCPCKAYGTQDQGLHFILLGHVRCNVWQAYFGRTPGKQDLHSQIESDLHGNMYTGAL